MPKAIITKYIGPSNVRGARIKAKDCDGNSITLGYDYAMNADERHAHAAHALCDKMKWKGKLAMGWLGNDAVHVFID